MFISLNTTIAARNKTGISLATCLLLALFSASASAQGLLNSKYPELADLFSAFDVTQGELLESVVAINEDSSMQAARNELESQLKMAANMTMSEMMAMGHGHNGDMGMGMGAAGPYDSLEAENRAALIAVLRSDHSAEDAQAAFNNSSALDQHTARVFQLGREFEARIFEIYLDDGVRNKESAIDTAVQEYLSDARHSMPTQPKAYSLVSDHPQATAFQTGFPKLSGLLWSNQWLQLASLEAIMIENVDSQFTDTVPITLERYWNKIGSESGMTMFPAPSDLPMAATITPHLYSFHPEAAIIIDNLNMLETVVADILAYPNLDDRQPTIDAAVLEFTNKSTNITVENDYLLAALRGGIYNQGGPAIGQLERSERNRTRSAMDMTHTMIMSTPQ